MIADVLAALVLVCLFFRPALWLARKLVRREEEMVHEIGRGIPPGEKKHVKKS